MNYFRVGFALGKNLRAKKSGFSARACTRAPVRPRATVRISQGFGTKLKQVPKNSQKKRPKHINFFRVQFALRKNLRAKKSEQIAKF